MSENKQCQIQRLIEAVSGSGLLQEVLLVFSGNF